MLIVKFLWKLDSAWLEGHLFFHWTSGLEVPPTKYNHYFALICWSNPGFKYRCDFSATSSFPFPIKYSTLNMHKHHQWSFGHTVPAKRLLSDITQRIAHLDCPFKHEGMAFMAMPDCRHHLQSVWGSVMHFKCILLREITSLWRKLNTVLSFIFSPAKHRKSM